jgi:hypothetical protein
MQSKILAQLAFALSVLLCACSGSATQLVVVVDSDLEVGTALSQITIQIQSSEFQPEVWKRDFELMAEEDLPLSFGVAVSSGEENEVHIEAHAISPDNTTRVSRGAVVSLLEGKSLILELNLVQACVPKVCGENETCLSSSNGQAACGSVFVDPTTLVEQVVAGDEINN